MLNKVVYVALVILTTTSLFIAAMYPHSKAYDEELKSEINSIIGKEDVSTTTAQHAKEKTSNAAQCGVTSTTTEKATTTSEAKETTLASKTQTVEDATTKLSTTAKSTTTTTMQSTTKPSTTKASTTKASTTKSSSSVSASAIYSAAYFKRQGVLYYNNWRWTYYSEKVLPGPGLKIPGRHNDENGYVCDENNYICLASSTLSKGTVVNTPFGKQGKVYDSGCAADTLDVYVNW